MKYPKITKITKVKQENKNIKTLLFNLTGKIVAGQFFMVWIPGVDEIPMSVSYINTNIKGITFRRVGEATNALFKLKEGDKIGIRGPYGNGFKIVGTKILFVGGGTGIAILAPAVEVATRKKIVSTVIIGVKNKKELFFEKRLKNYGAYVYVATDDGSQGFKGYASTLAKELLTKEDFTSIITCGPEPMMKNLLDTTKDLSFQASVDRYIKCGMGVCGQCCIGKGLRVCEEGPVFDGKTLKDSKDFGRFTRDASGRKILFK